MPSDLEIASLAIAGILCVATGLWLMLRRLDRQYRHHRRQELLSELEDTRADIVQAETFLRALSKVRVIDRASWAGRIRQLQRRERKIREELAACHPRSSPPAT